MRSLIEHAKRKYVYHGHEISQSLTFLLGKNIQRSFEMTDLVRLKF